MGISRVACFAANAQGNIERDDHVDFESDQFRREFRKTFRPPFGGAKLECKILSFHVAKLTQSFAEFLRERLGVCDPQVDCAYSGHLGSLRQHREGPQ